MIEIQAPSITAQEPELAIPEMQRYLRILHEELVAALASVEGQATAAAQTGSKAMQAAAERQSPAQIFGRIKDLIIKSADIVEAYQEQMQLNMDGRYTAISDFGTFKEVTGARITANSTQVEQMYTSLEEIESKVEGISDSQMSMAAYIRTGKLYEEGGVPRYGVEIGEQVNIDGAEQFRKFARLTSDKLSFFDANENEVAYVSDRKLHISEAEAERIEAREIETTVLNLGPYSITYGPDGHLTIT